MKLLVLVILLLASTLARSVSAQADHRLLATSQTSTMERELNDAARDGFVLVDAKGGETEHGGRELVAVLARDGSDQSREYLVLATNRTDTMQRELDEAARRGFVAAAQTVFETAFGGQEIVVIMERRFDETRPVCEYRLLATQRTSTMQKELSEMGLRGFVARGLSVSETAFGGKEVVVVMERCVAP